MDAKLQELLLEIGKDSIAQFAFLKKGQFEDAMGVQMLIQDAIDEYLALCKECGVCPFCCEKHEKGTSEQARMDAVVSELMRRSERG